MTPEAGEHRAPWVIPRLRPQWPEVTVVISGHRPEFAREAIASVEAQTIGIQHIELLHRRMDAWWGDKVNELTTLAKGKFLVLLCDDDRLHPTYLERCLAERGSADIVYTDTQIFGQRNFHWRMPPFGLSTFRWAAVPWTTALERLTLWRDVKGYDPDQDYQDTAHWIECAKRGATAVHIEEPLFESREHAAQGGRLMNVSSAALRMQAKYPDLYPARFIAPEPVSEEEAAQRATYKRWQEEFRAKYRRPAA